MVWIVIVWLNVDTDVTVTVLSSPRGRRVIDGQEVGDGKGEEVEGRRCLSFILLTEASFLGGGRRYFLVWRW